MKQKISLSDYIHISIFLEEPTDNNIHFMGYIYTICTLPMYYHNHPKHGKQERYMSIVSI